MKNRQVPSSHQEPTSLDRTMFACVLGSSQAFIPLTMGLNIALQIETVLNHMESQPDE